MTDKQDEGLLLTPDERKPYLAMEKCQITDSLTGVYDHEYEVWHIDNLLKAQLAQAKPLIERQERERIIAWGLEVCPHWAGKQTREVGIIKRDCSLCWQTLEGE